MPHLVAKLREGGFSLPDQLRFQKPVLKPLQKIGPLLPVRLRLVVRRHVSELNLFPDQTPGRLPIPARDVRPGFLEIQVPLLLPPVMALEAILRQKRPRIRIADREGQEKDSGWDFHSITARWNTGQYSPDPGSLSPPRGRASLQGGVSRRTSLVSSITESAAAVIVGWILPDPGGLRARHPSRPAGSS